MKVKATAAGFYGGARRRAGEVFEAEKGAKATWFVPFKAEPEPTPTPNPTNPAGSNKNAGDLV